MNRRCRTCPRIFDGVAGSDQCTACQERSAIVREAVRPAPPAVHVPAPRAYTCTADGHHACEHYQAVYRYVRDFMADCDWCPICGVEAEGADDIVHKLGCALIALVGADEGC